MCQAFSLSFSLWTQGCKPQGRSIFIKQSLLFYFHTNMMRCKETKRNVQNLRQIPLKFYHFPEYIKLKYFVWKKYSAMSESVWNEMMNISIYVLSCSDPARVVFTPTIQYLPLHLSGIIHCHIESHPPFQFITWTKDKRIFDPFDMEEIQTLTNGSLLITKVRRWYNDVFCR